MKHSFPESNRKNIAFYFLMGITAILITVTGILFKQSFLRMLPLYISLVIALLQSHVSRYAPLIGSVNAILYAIVYVYYHLYASAAYAILISGPLQLVTFIRWSKQPWQGSTILRKLSTRQRLAVSAVSLLLCGTIYFMLQGTGSQYRVLDSASTILGILATVLTMLSYIEYTVVMLLGQVCSIVLYIAMLQTSPEQITYLIQSVYTMVCTVSAFLQANRIYAKQQAQKSKNISEPTKEKQIS